MFEALKKLFGKKQNPGQAKPASDAQRSQRPASDAALVMTTFTIDTFDSTSGNTDSYCDSGDSSSCDGGSSGGD